MAQGEGPHEPKGRIKITDILVPGRRDDHVIGWVPKTMHAIQTRFSGYSAASDEKGASTLIPNACNCLRIG